MSVESQRHVSVLPVACVQIPELKEAISVLCGEGGKMATADPATHHDIIREQLDQLHQQVHAVHMYTVT